MQEDNFIFSLYPNDLIYIEGKRDIKVKLRKKLKESSSLPQEKTLAEGFFYYRSTGIAVASIQVFSSDGAYVQESLGVKTLKKVEKWSVDVLGGGMHPVKREMRQDFSAMKHDPHSTNHIDDC